MSPEPEHPFICTGELGQSTIKDHGQMSVNLQKYSFGISLLSGSPGKQVVPPNWMGVEQNYI